MTTVLIGHRDEFQGHSHISNRSSTTRAGGDKNTSAYSQDDYHPLGSIKSDCINGEPRYGKETTPKCMTVKYWKRTA